MTVEINRLKWGCRRGLLELDIIFERFLEKNDPRGLEELLELPDNDLLDIVMGRSEAYGPHLNDIVARLRAA
jgi:succinate dehydrogenase flavin-adding protein (antitoxin of CptAB toxin-antitoxin module)